MSLKVLSSWVLSEFLNSWTVLIKIMLSEEVSREEVFKWVVSREAVCHLFYSFWWVKHYHLLPEHCVLLSRRGGSFFLDLCMRDAEEGILLFLSLCMIVPGDCILTFELPSGMSWLIKAVLLGDFLPAINFVIAMKGRCLWWLMRVGRAIQTELTSFGYSEQLSVAMSICELMLIVWVIVVMTEFTINEYLSLLS